jgi:predicted DNA-binding transcriptional regulator AlpA
MSSPDRTTKNAPIRVVIDVPAELVTELGDAAAEVAALDPKQQPLVSTETVFGLLGIDRSTGYRAIREGTFPLPIIRIGRIIRIPTVAVQRLLTLGTQQEAAPPDMEAD